MNCPHRFLNLHREGLFPDWKIKYLFIGTFNPSWDGPGANADYFYGRSAYMWLLLSRFFGEEGLENRSAAEKIEFCKRHEVGFTDLIKSIQNVDPDNEADKARILSFKDKDLLQFGENIEFNTEEIIRFIDNNPSIERIYFTLLGKNVGDISNAISNIELHCGQKGSPNTYRLHTPTGQRVGAGSPRKNVLTHRWFQQGMNFVNPDFDVTAFPFFPKE